MLISYLENGFWKVNQDTGESILRCIWCYKFQVMFTVQFLFSQSSFMQEVIFLKIVFSL